MKNVLILGCAFPPELPHFARGLARVGARVIGVDQIPESALPPMARDALSGYLQVDSLFDDLSAAKAIRSSWLAGITFDHIESLWEPTVLLAARLRDALGVPGLSYEEALAFRDKDRMKSVVAAAGIRTARHARATSARECFEAAELIGYPLCLKPVAGAGSADTFRVESDGEMQEILGRVGHIGEYNVEEFIDGDEFTYDTISIDGIVQYENVSWYRPRPLIGRSVEWISPQTITLKDLDAAVLQEGKALGLDVLRALGHQTGFAHMEWYRKSDGEAVFGEIAARPPGAHTVDTMNYVGDVDLFTGWAEAVVQGKFSMSMERNYNCAIVYKRAQGQGVIRRIEGLDRILSSFGEHIPAFNLLAVGEHRRDWVRTLLSDGFVYVRHPDLQTTLEMVDRVGAELQLFAG